MTTTKDTAKLHREWLRNLPALTGKPLTRMAQEIQIARSTLTRPLKDDDAGKSTLNARTIEKIVEHFKVPPPGALDAAAPACDALLYTSSLAITKIIKELHPNLHNKIRVWEIKSRALELEGFLPGDVVFVEENAEPKNGDIVCAIDAKDSCFMRVFQQASVVNLLVARTLDRRLQETIVIDRERVIVKGVLLPHRLRPH